MDYHRKKGCKILIDSRHFVSHLATKLRRDELEILKPALEEEKKNRVGIFYFDEKKAKRYSAGSKNPGGIPSGVLHTIHDEGSPGKGEFKKQTGTLQFKEWFRKSKVVDEAGKPLVVYHGADSDFTVFDMDKTRLNMDIRGAFFSPYEDEPVGSGKNVRAFFLSIQKPATAEQAYKVLRMFQGEKDAGTKARDYLIKQGYDGVVDEGYEYIAFYPEQVKSATDNIGTFDPENQDVRFSIEQYSDADWSDMVTYMKAKVGDLLTKSDAEYKKMLESAGMECYSEADAHACAVEAMNANLEDAKARRKEEMMNWIVENNTWIQRIAEVTGSPEFKIRPSYRFQGMDFTGAYISQAWRDCSGNPKAKNREKRLKESEAEVETAEGVCDPVPFLDIVIEPAVDFDLFFFCGLLLKLLTELLFVFAFFDGVGGERFRAGIEAFVFFDDLFDFVEFGFFATFFAVCGEETFALEVGVVRDDHIGGDFLSGFFGEEFCGFFGGDGGGGAGFFGFAVIDPGSGEGFVRAVVFGTGVDLEVFAVFPHKKFGPFIGVIDCVAFAFVTGFECAFALHFDGECGGVAEEFFIVYGVEMPSAFCEDGGCFFWFDEV